ncbi:hypothetical protein BJY04DRAFT_204881 [Aspergillus karnatakaensis]|uniref:uncharacterized protein n=1 Tax=Aspergillus karnatakaensis TaxID=1810916 RepID=UPI003CCCD2FA
MKNSKSLMSGGAKFREDGRIEVKVDSTACRAVAELIGAPPPDELLVPPSYDEVLRFQTSKPIDLQLNVVIQVVGSRGDLQPFVALGNELQKHGHRVRLATHNHFATFIRNSGLEFYPIGGNPTELMAFMAKNPGLIPHLHSLRASDLQRKREMVAEILDGCWRSCIEDDPLTKSPFVAEAIIANPPSFAHVHCAQALGIPVHLMFTMPWSSTKAFPHPLANLQYSITSQAFANYMSYGIVGWLMWQGLGDVINTWRSKLDLEPVPVTEGPMLVETLRIPITYCWSPALMAKPADWPAHIDVCGFFFRDAPNYTPPKSLEAFLQSGPAPIYIGFGSIVIDNPGGFLSIILEAVRLSKIRAVISRGWAKLEGDYLDNVYYIDDCPHEWIFQHVSAVVHHGGAGTTACGLRNGRSTAIVPFFGDQPFWGNLVATSGAGPSPIPYREVNVDNLAAAIQCCLQPETQRAARDIASKMQYERGAEAAVNSFYQNLPVAEMRCDLLSNRAVTWVCKSPRLRLSKLAAQVLAEHSRVDKKDLHIYESKPLAIENRRWDPVTGATSAVIEAHRNMVKSAADMLLKPYQEYQDSQRGRSEPSRPSTSRSMTAPPSTSTPDLESPAASISEHKLLRYSTGLRAIGNMAAASALSASKVLGYYVKGVMVDIPLATAEGLRAIPRLYGEEKKDRGIIKDWKSGLTVGSETMSHGLVDGLTGLITQPYKGAKEEGALGAVKGLAKGTIGATAEVGSAAVGLIAYPSQGIYKSIHSSMKYKTRKAIMRAYDREGQHLALALRGSVNRSAVVQAFEYHRHRGGK